MRPVSKSCPGRPRRAWVWPVLLALCCLLIAAEFARTSGAAEAQGAAQKWEYGTVVQVPGSLAWNGPQRKRVEGTSFADFYKKLGGAGADPGTADLYNLLGAEGWEYAGIQDVLAVSGARITIFKRHPR